MADSDPQNKDITMKTELDTLHIASFTGNVGDNANHNGTRKTLNENTDFEYEYTENEIRRYYQNYTKEDALAFDDEFIQQANDHDLVIIGSGNFFELWIETSATGTTIDIEPDRVKEIKTPIVFYGLGCDPYKGVPDNNAEKFQNFLDIILEADQCLVSVRNDGSLSHIEDYFGNEYAKKIKKVPDGGFFTQVEDHYHPELDTEGPLIAINIAKDMADLRFPSSNPNSHTYDSFITEFSNLVDRILSTVPDAQIIFIPHIYSDLDAISDILNQIEDMNRRSRVTTAPYLNGEGAEKYIFDTYRKANIAVGMRFHTNVCSIGQQTPSIGLVSYPKVADLYEDLDIAQRTVDIKNKGFSDSLYNKILSSIESDDSVANLYKNINIELRQSVDDFHQKIEKMVKKGSYIDTS
jgi:polysaccharide pyruvyl transferase WcaK-like protein